LSQILFVQILFKLRGAPAIERVKASRSESRAAEIRR